MARVVAEVVEVRGSGKCWAGHVVGERFIFTAHKTPVMCLSAIGALHAPVAVLLNGGKFSWATADKPVLFCCPDPVDTVVFRLAREEE